MCISPLHVALDSWLGLVACMIEMSDGNRFQSWMHATGGHYFVFGCLGVTVYVQVAQNDFLATERTSPGYFWLVNGNFPGKPYVCNWSHYYVFCFAE